MIWTNEMIALLMIRRIDNIPYDSIRREFKKTFGVNTSNQTLTNKYNSLTTLNSTQIDFLYGCYMNNFSMTQTLEGFKEQFGFSLSNKKYKEAMLSFPTEALVAHENNVSERLKNKTNNIKTETEKIKQEMKNMKRTAWTKEEDEELLACGSWKKAMELDNGRSRGAKNARWAYLKNRPVEETVEEIVEETPTPAKRGRMTLAELEMIRNCKTVEEALALNLRKPETITRQFNKFKKISREEFVAKKAIKKVQGNKRGKYTPRWTVAEDYDLILHFYELSIDEARNRFNRSYGAIANRLETLVDSTKPEHISMLMEASKEIKARKKAQNSTPKKSRRTLRRERKQAKREAKLVSKLKRLRGIENE